MKTNHIKSNFEYTSYFVWLAQTFCQSYVLIYIGSLNSAVVRVGEVFRAALRENAAGLIIIHNHPSGDPSPSKDDIRVTKEIVKAGKILSIQVLDHLVIGNNQFVSMRERGLGFDN